MPAHTAADLILLQFARQPIPGQVKTRMLSELSPVQACDLHCELVQWTCGQLLACGLGPVTLCVAGDCTDALFSDCTNRGVERVIKQQGADLGERMLQALQAALAVRKRAILVGSDCPAINKDYLQQAYQALDSVDVVIGPADDGGFVLIGASRLDPAIFRNVRWGDSEVYAATVANLDALGLSWRALPSLPDIDRPEDLQHWYAQRDLVE